MEQTGGIFDVAVEGDGYLVVGSDHGPRLHASRPADGPTWSGGWSTSNGLPVLGTGDQPIHEFPVTRSRS